MQWRIKILEEAILQDFSRLSIEALELELYIR